MALLNPEHVRAVISAINQGPYFKHLSMPVVALGTGFSMVELRVNRAHLNPFGGIHGGAYASVIDTAAYWAAYCEIEETAGLISLDLKIDFLASTRDGVLTARGRSLKIGRTVCLAEAVATDPDGRCVARGTSKMLVTRGRQTIGDALRFTGTEPLPPQFI